MAATPPPAARRPALLIGGGVLVVAVGFGVPPLLTATPPAPAAVSPADPPPGPGVGAALGRLVLCVAALGGLCVVAAKWGRPAAAPAGPMAAVASIRVDTRCTVHLVKAGDRLLLLGTDPGGVKALLELPRAEADDGPTLTPGADGIAEGTLPVRWNPDPHGGGL